MSQKDAIAYNLCDVFINCPLVILALGLFDYKISSCMPAVYSCVWSCLGHVYLSMSFDCG